MIGRAFRSLCLGLAALAVATCAPRGEITLDPAAAQIGAVETVLVASARLPLAEGFGYSGQIAPGLSFSRVEVSVPPARQPGTVTFPPAGRLPDPETDFLTVSATRLADPATFIRAVNAEVAHQPAGQRDAFVFVHGFNTNFAEGLYRQAQMRHDFQSPGVSIHFAWPSAARVSAYGTDRESALVARDELQTLLSELAHTNVSRIVVLGHSMGAFVAMEGLRQIALENDRAVLAKLDSVVLMAPDLDIEAFRRQMLPLADKGVEAYVFTSSRDLALRVSARLRGSTERLGLITDDAPLSGLPVEVIDLSALDTSGDVSTHFKAATSPTVIAIARGLGTVGLHILRDQTLGVAPIGAGLIAGSALSISDGPSGR